uniref:Uncharacterized protein n=1 Tax=Cacopsylla melanoneura TaxID=428564 RepID=A0A8D8ZCB4_9HEMI
MAKFFKKLIIWPERSIIYANLPLALWANFNLVLIYGLDIKKETYTKVIQALDKYFAPQTNSVFGVNDKLHFSILRKSTFTDCVISKSSNHPENIKYAAFHSMLIRLISIPMDTDITDIRYQGIDFS